MSDIFGEQVAITPSERELVLYLAQGVRVRDAAPMMGVTVGTARGYATSLRKKLFVRKIEQIPDAYMAMTGEDPYEAAAWMS